MTMTMTEKRPALIRHHYSGVWIGYLIGRGTVSADSILLDGRRIWSWCGARLEMSQVAQTGPSPNDRLGNRCTVELPVAPGDGLVEVLFPRPEIVEAFFTAPVTVV